MDEILVPGDPAIDHVTIDWREVRPGSLYVARTGWYIDGHDRIPEALSAGASALVVSARDRLPPGVAVPVVEVERDDPFLARVCDRFYGSPTRELKVYGVTGTNGKTSVTYLLEAMLSALGERVAVMGTIDYRIDGVAVMPATNTTPDAVVIQRFARLAADRGATALILEVSSHALAIGRCRAIAFDCVGFTNLSRDHLDFHSSLDEYRAAKGLLFSDSLLESQSMGKQVRAVACIDDDGVGASMLARAPDGALTAKVRVDDGEEAAADFHARALQTYGLDGMDVEFQAPQGQVCARSPLLGDYNVWNIGLAAAMALDPSRAQDALAKVAWAIKTFIAVPGRLEQVFWGPAGETPRIFVDYAHTPDALDKVLHLLRTKTEKLTVVVGCGGDRDAEKRPLMGTVAAVGATDVVLTTDNPRSENPEAIIDAMMSGIDAPDRPRVHRVVDRTAAIALGLELAVGGVLLVVGKGHETYQEIGGRRFPFDDRVELRRCIVSRHIGRPPAETPLVTGWDRERLGRSAGGNALLPDLIMEARARLRGTVFIAAHRSLLAAVATCLETVLDATEIVLGKGRLPSIELARRLAPIHRACLLQLPKGDDELAAVWAMGPDLVLVPPDREVVVPDALDFRVGGVEELDSLDWRQIVSRAGSSPHDPIPRLAF
jgi:UDP-N-acetylmuramoyl-L-alanyl-D-glutamate--2,6-diaminopimelate ligase